MAYEDPAFISSERMNLSLTPAEKQVVKAIAAINGVQPTTFMKMLAFSALRREHGIDLDTNSQEKRRANAQRNWTHVQNEDEQIVVAGKDLELLKSTALSMGITPQELLSRLVSSEIRHRYVNTSLTSASVVPFRRRRIDAAIPNFPVTQEAQK